MKLFFSFFIFIISLIAPAQSYKVIYDVILNDIKTEAILFTDSEKALTVVKTKLTPSKTFDLNINVRDTFTFEKGDDIFFIKKDTVTADDIILPNKYWVKEQLPSINIDSLNQDTAWFKFRGRKYIVKFDNTYNLPYGPLKFNGFPGLITEINTMSSNFFINFKLKEIEEIDINWINLEKQLLKIKEKPIQYNKFINKLNLKLNNDIEILESIESIHDLIKNPQLPIKVEVMENEKYEGYNSKWEKEMERINDFL